MKNRESSRATVEQEKAKIEKLIDSLQKEIQKKNFDENEMNGLRED